MLERIRNQITDLRKEEERRFTYELECSFDKEHSIEYSEWINTIRDISDRDKIKIYLVSEGEDTLHLDENMEDEYIQFLDSLDDDEIVDVNLTIDKKIVNGYLSIYCFEKFAEDINSLPIDKALNVFSGFMKEAGNVMVFELFDSLKVLDNVKEVGAYLASELDKIVAEYDIATERRGMGLIQGLQLSVNPKDVIANALDNGLILFSAGTNVIRFVPPLVITKADVDEMIVRLKKSLDSCR